jgi:hypothetical protein
MFFKIYPNSSYSVISVVNLLSGGVLRGQSAEDEAQA